MTLTVDLDRTSVTQDGSESNWTDNTVYGGSGPLRNAVAVYLTAYKVDVDQVETALQVDDFDPETETDFVTQNGDKDGWLKYYYIVVPRYSGGTTYNKYDLVWDVGQGAFYEYTYSTPFAGIPVTSATYWSVVPDPCAKLLNIGTSSEPLNIAYQIINKVLSVYSSVCFIQAMSLKAKESCASDDCGCNSKISRLATKIRDLFSNLPLNESTGEYLQGEKNARLLEKYCDDCGCIER